MLIPQAKIKKYCAVNNLGGMTDFLSHISKDLQRFAAFLGDTGMKIPNPPAPILFHGSQKRLDKLDLNAPIGTVGAERGESLVYATNNPNYAIFLAIIDLAEGGNASVLVENDKTFLSVDVGFVNGNSQIKDGYVHVVDATQFKPNENDEYISQLSARILFSINVKPSDLTEKIWIKID